MIAMTTSNSISVNALIRGLGRVGTINMNNKLHNHDSASRSSLKKDENPPHFHRSLHFAQGGLHFCFGATAAFSHDSFKDTGS